MKNKNETFTYTYSAKQQEEVKQIYQKYVPRTENKMETLIRLDKSATKLGTIVSIIVGVVGTLIMGTGMSCVMVWASYVPGILLGIIGIIGIALAYPLFNIITRKEREKLAPQIVQISEELMGQ